MPEASGVITGRPLGVDLAMALGFLDSNECAPLSGVIVSSGTRNRDELSDDLRGLAQSNLGVTDGQGGHFDGLLSEPFLTDYVEIDPFADGRNISVWFLTPSPINPMVDAACFPEGSEFKRLRAGRFVALVPSAETTNGPDPRLAQALCQLLAPWSKLQIRLVDLLSAEDPELDDEYAASGENLSDAVRNLRNPGAREEGKSLQVAYRHGRLLEQRKAICEQVIELEEDRVLAKKMMPGRVIGAGEEAWLQGAGRQATSLLEKLSSAQTALSQLTTQATQVFTYLNLTQSEQTRSLITIVGTVVFLLGILGVYIDSFQTGDELLRVDSEGTAFTILAIAAIAAYSLILVLVYRSASVRGRRTRQVAQIITVALVVGGLVGTVSGAPVIGLAALALAGISIAALVEQD